MEVQERASANTITVVENATHAILSSMAIDVTNVETIIMGHAVLIGTVSGKTGLLGRHVARGVAMAAYRNGLVNMHTN